MILNFSIHNFFSIRVVNAPEQIGAFLKEELGYFSKEEDIPDANLEIEFVEKIELPKDCIYLQRSLPYRGGFFYFSESKGLLQFPIKDILNQTICVKAEDGVSKWNVLHVIEKVLSLKVVEKGYSMLHALGLKEKEEINLYVGLQGAGKTELALQKLGNGSGFIGEEFIFVDRHGTAFCYPRGMNVHRFMKTEYPRLKNNSDFAWIIFRERLFLHILRLLKYAYFAFRPIRCIFDRALEAKRFYRVYVKNIFPDVRIIKEAHIDNIYIFFKDKGGPNFTPCHCWDKKRLLNFMLTNNCMERNYLVSSYIDSFTAYGDSHSVTFQDYIAGIKNKEHNIISNMLERIYQADNEQELKESSVDSK